MMTPNLTLVMHFSVLLLTFIAFILLIITTFSTPISSSLYFLHATQARGVKFGIWGWCLDEDTCLSPLQLGYTWEPQISTPITGALVLYPIASISTFLLLISLIPIFRARTTRADRVFQFFAVVSLVFSAFAFIFMIATFDVARRRFRSAGFSARYGPLPWASLFATLCLGVVAVLSFKIQPPEPQLQVAMRPAKDEESRLTSPRPRRHPRSQSRRY